MKLPFFWIIYFTLCSQALAQIQITLNNGRVLNNCQSQTKGMYNCEDNYLVGLPSPAFAVSNQDGNLQISTPLSAMIDGQTVLQSMPGFGFNALSSKEMTVNDRLGELKRVWFDIMNAVALSSSGSSDQTGAKTRKILEDLDLAISEAQSILSSNVIEWRNPQGQKYVCSRLKSSNTERQCPFFGCQSGEDESTSNFLHFNTSGSFFIPHVFDTNQEISARTPAAISSDQGAALWSDPSYAPNVFETKAGLEIPSYLMFGLKTELETCTKEDSQDLTNAFSDYFEGLKSLELIQYINILDGQLNSSYLAPGALPAGGCRQDGIYYDSEQTFRKTAQYRENDQRSLSLAEAKELFNFAKAMDMPWEYKQDGCYARAHLMAREFEKMGHDVDKAWAKGDLRVGEGAQAVMWNYHVAPAINVVEEDGSVKRYVIDPSIMDGPVPAQEWANIMAEQTGSRINRSAFPFPENAANYLRVGLAFSSSDAYWPYPEEGLTEEEKLKEARETLTRYQGFLDEMD